MARYVAKNIVAPGWPAAEVQLSYAIGVADPVSVHVETFGRQADGPELPGPRPWAGNVPAQAGGRDHLDYLNLRRPIYTLRDSPRRALRTHGARIHLGSDRQGRQTRRTGGCGSSRREGAVTRSDRFEAAPGTCSSRQVFAFSGADCPLRNGKPFLFSRVHRLEFFGAVIPHFGVSERINALFRICCCFAGFFSPSALHRQAPTGATKERPGRSCGASSTPHTRRVRRATINRLSTFAART